MIQRKPFSPFVILSLMSTPWFKDIFNQVYESTVSCYLVTTNLYRTAKGFSFFVRNRRLVKRWQDDSGNLLLHSSALFSLIVRSRGLVKGTQDWEFFWLQFRNLRYFFVSYIKILRLYKKNFLIDPLLGEVRFFRVVLGQRGMKKNFDLGQKNYFFLLQFWTLNMTQY
jgi:hypothetical protein